MSKQVNIVQHWGGCPQVPNSKWRRFLRITERCAERGWRSYLVWSRMPEDPGLSRPFLEAGCEIILQRRAKRNFDLRCVLDTYRMLQRIPCDIFHCHNVHTSPLIAAAIAGVPVRIWSKLAMSPYYEEGIRPKGIHRLALSIRASAALASKVLAISKAVKEELTDLGVAAREVRVMGITVDLGQYRGHSDGDVRKDLGISESDMVITTVGHAVPVKGWDILVRAFAMIAANNSGLRLLMVGSTRSPDEIPTAEQSQKLAAELRVDRRVNFLGIRSDIPEILGASDIFVLPSRSEGMPAALVEAMAAGLPCIGARTGGIPEVIQDEYNGVLFEREDEVGLASALNNMIHDQTLRTRLGDNGKESSKQYGMEQATEKILGLYQELLGKRQAAKDPFSRVGPLVSKQPSLFLTNHRS